MKEPHLNNQQSKRIPRVSKTFMSICDVTKADSENRFNRENSV